MLERTFSEEQTDTALCIWGELIELREKLPDLSAYWDLHGGGAMRSRAVDLIAFVDSVYAALPEDVRDSLPFDFEILPEIVARVSWGINGPALPEPGECAAAVARSLGGGSGTGDGPA